MIFAKHMFNIDTKYVKYLAIFVEYLHNTLPTFSLYVCNICTMFKQCFQNIHTIFLQYLHNICTIFDCTITTLLFQHRIVLIYFNTDHLVLLRVGNAAKLSPTSTIWAYYRRRFSPTRKRLLGVTVII